MSIDAKNLEKNQNILQKVIDFFYEMVYNEMQKLL